MNTYAIPALKEKRAAIAGRVISLKKQIARHHKELATRLKAHGMNENAASIANKISRGTFAATFFLACLVALELNGIRIEDI